MTIDFFKRVGYKEPWISYYAMENGGLVGCGAFKEPQKWNCRNCLWNI
jgi:hypothetical protein